MELKEGMYVRTERHGISKLYREFYEDEVDVGIGIMFEIDGFFIDKEEIYWIGKDEVLKASYNIIDLIEVGDYVNGYKVVDLDIELDEVVIVCLSEYDGVEQPVKKHIKEKNIKSIVTKEMFANAEYKVETN